MSLREVQLFIGGIDVGMLVALVVVAVRGKVRPFR